MHQSPSHNVPISILLNFSEGPPAPIAKKEPEPEPVKPVVVNVRSNFNPLAHFTPSVQVDKDGKASVKVTLPDNITRYRGSLLFHLFSYLVYGVASSADGHYFGLHDSTFLCWCIIKYLGLITAQLPILLRPTPPRFLSCGDSCEFPIIVQNLTTKKLKLK